MVHQGLRKSTEGGGAATARMAPPAMLSRKVQSLSVPREGTRLQIRRVTSTVVDRPAGFRSRGLPFFAMKSLHLPRRWWCGLLDQRRTGRQRTEKSCGAVKTVQMLPSCDCARATANLECSSSAIIVGCTGASVTATRRDDGRCRFEVACRGDQWARSPKSVIPRRRRFRYRPLREMPSVDAAADMCPPACRSARLIISVSRYAVACSSD